MFTITTQTLLAAPIGSRIVHVDTKHVERHLTKGADSLWVSPAGISLSSTHLWNTLARLGGTVTMSVTGDFGQGSSK